MMSVFCPYPKSLSHFGRRTLNAPAPLSSLGEGLGVEATSGGKPSVIHQTMTGEGE